MFASNHDAHEAILDAYDAQADIGEKSAGITGSNHSLRLAAKS